MWRWNPEPPMDVAKSWAEEGALSRRRRRERYRCGDDFVTLKALLPWTVTLVAQFRDAHDPPAPVEPAAPAAAADAAVPAEGQAKSEADKLADDVAKLSINETAPATETKPAEPAAASTEVKPAESKAEDAAAVAPAEAKAEEKSAESKAEDSDSDSDSDEQPAPEVRSKPKEVYTPNAALNRKITIWQGDITRLEIDAVVNAANSSLLGGGGIDGAIHRAAGDKLVAECETLNGAHTGETKITRGYKLPAKFVLHTVGPMGENPTKLENCYTSCLDLVVKHNIRSVAFCGISTGIYGYPLFPASRVALRTIRRWLENEENQNKIDRIIFCTFLDREQACYTELAAEYFPPTPDKAFYEQAVEAFKQWEHDGDSEDEVSEESDESEDEASATVADPAAPGAGAATTEPAATIEPAATPAADPVAPASEQPKAEGIPAPAAPAEVQHLVEPYVDSAQETV